MRKSGEPKVRAERAAAPERARIPSGDRRTYLFGAGLP
jgi:hypothetical protein